MLYFYYSRLSRKKIRRSVCVCNIYKWDLTFLCIDVFENSFILNRRKCPFIEILRKKIGLFRANGYDGNIFLLFLMIQFLLFKVLLPKKRESHKLCRFDFITFAFVMWLKNSRIIDLESLELRRWIEKLVGKNTIVVAYKFVTFDDE